MDLNNKVDNKMDYNYIHGLCELMHDEEQESNIAQWEMNRALCASILGLLVEKGIISDMEAIESIVGPTEAENGASTETPKDRTIIFSKAGTEYEMHANGTSIEISVSIDNINVGNLVIQADMVASFLEALNTCAEVLRHGRA